jgi:tRNA (guanine37-N1)-methyltransferase
MILIDGVTRLIPGVLGNDMSAIDESHTIEGVLEYPHYTKPEVFTYKKGLRKITMKVPEVLTRGHHKNIEKWREENRKK